MIKGVSIIAIIGNGGNNNAITVIGNSVSSISIIDNANNNATDNSVIIITAH